MSTLISAKDLTETHATFLWKCRFPLFFTPILARDAFSPYDVPLKNQHKSLSKNTAVKNKTLLDDDDTDMNDLENNFMLNDNAINVGHELIKSKFQNSRGLQNVLLGSLLKFKVYLKILLKFSIVVNFLIGLLSVPLVLLQRWFISTIP